MLFVPTNVNAKKIENNSKSGKLSLEDTRKQYNALDKKDITSLNNFNDYNDNAKSVFRKADKQSRPKQNKNLLEYDSDESSIPINNSFSFLTEEDLCNEDKEDSNFWPSTPKKSYSSS